MSDIESKDLEIQTFDTSDEDLHFLLQREIVKNTNYIDDTVKNYDEETFFQHFRMSRGAVQTIVERYVANEFYTHHWRQYGKILSYDQISFQQLIFSYLQNRIFRDVADRFGISLSSLHRILHKVIVFVSSMSPQIINWPTEEEKIESEQKFRGNGFPGVIGAIDGCHIKLYKPENDNDSYVNRKGYYSIKMHVVCKHKLQIIDVFVGYHGSVHDSRVFRNSPLSHELEEKCGQFFLLGDSGYPLRRNLLTPFRDRGQLTPRQLNYNLRLSRNRYMIEHCFGIIKQKFRQLYHIKLRDIVLTVHLIRAACVLHNIALSGGIHLENNEPIALELLEDEADGQANKEVDVHVQEVRNNVVDTLPI